MNTNTNRPYIFCHMLTSLDGKIMGKYMDIPECEGATNAFYNIAFGKNAYYKHQGWLSGRITTDDNFTFYHEPILDKHAPSVPKGNFIAQKHSMYYVSIDPTGRLGWKENTITYGDTKAHIIEILTEKVSNEYKYLLRQLGISYIIVGNTSINYEKTLSLLYDEFGIETLMLGGGGVLNWSFIQQGFCDELSLVLAPVADGSDKTASLFSVREGLTKDSPVSFTLEHMEKMQADSIWLRYKVNRR